MNRQCGWKMSLKVCCESIRKWRGDARVFAVIALVVLFEWVQIEGLRRGCIANDLSISCWVFPHLIVDVNAIFYYFGVLLLFCDAPFIDNQQMDVILRVGKRNWFRGKIIYIMAASAMYFGLMFLVSVLEFVPYVGFSWKWEDMMNILSVDGAYGGIIRRNILVAYMPIEAVIVEYFVCVFWAIFLGLLIFYCNLYRKNNIGMGIALLLVLMGTLVYFVDAYVMRVLIYFLPMAWTNIEVFKREAEGVSFVYAMSMLSIGIMVLVILIMRKSKSYSIDCQEEM